MEQTRTEEDEGAKVLTRAKEVLLTQGWAQGDGSRAGGPVCILDAVWTSCNQLYVGPSSSRVRGSFQACNRLQHILLVASEYDVIDWNDVAGRTQEEVMGVLDKAIALKPPY